MESEADCSMNLPESFARWDQDTLSWRTSQRCLLEGWEMFLEPWPRSGMTVTGTAYLLPQLVLRTSGTGSSYLPTVVAHEPRLGWQPRHAKARGYQKSLTTILMEQAGRKIGSKWNGGQLNPRWIEWFMGFPEGWTDLDA